MTVINSEGTIPNECNTLGIVPFEIICHMFLSPPKSSSSLGCPSFCLRYDAGTLVADNISDTVFHLIDIII